MFPQYERFIPNVREELKIWFKNQGLTNLNYIDIPMTSNSNIKSPQIYPYTILLYYMHIIPYLADETIIYQGFIKEDSELHDKYLIFNHFDNISKFLDQKITIEFPLEYISKVDILEKLIELKIHDKVVWCVNLDNDGNPCNACRNCYMQAEGLAGLYMKKTHKNLPDEVFRCIYND